MMRPGDASILKTNSTGAPRTGIKGQAGRCDPDLATSQPRPSELFRLLYHSRRDHRALTWRQYFSQARAVLLVGFAFVDGHSISRMTLQYFEPRIHPSSPWRRSKRSSSGAILRKAASGTDLSIEIVDHGFRHIEPIRMLGGASWEELKSRFEASSPHQRWYISTVEPPPILHSNMADIYRQRVLALYESLQSEEEKAEAAEVLRTLVDQVTLVPEAEQLAIVLRRDLAAILRFVAGKKNPTSSRKPGLELCGILGDEAIRRRGLPACG